MIDLADVQARCAKHFGDEVSKVIVSVRDHGAMFGIGIVLHDGSRHAIALGPDEFPDAASCADDTCRTLRFWMDTLHQARRAR